MSANRPRASSAARLLAPLAIAGNLALGAVYIALFAVLFATGRTRGADFTAFYTGWRIVLEGHGSQLYDPAVQAEVQRRILGGQTFEAGLNPFNNPPHMVLPYLPLGVLPLDIAFLVWTAVQAALLLVILAVLLRGVAGDWTRTERAGLVAAFVAFPPLAISFFQGTFALVLVLGVAGAWLAMERRQDLRAGGLLALASVKPQGVFGVTIAMLLSRRPAAIVALASWGVALASVATVVLGPGIWSSYLSFLGSYTSSFDRYSVDPTVMWNLRGTLALVLGRDQAQLVNVIAYAGFAAGVVTVGFLWLRGWSGSGDRRAVNLRIAITILLTLLLSPHLNPHDDTLAAIAVALGYGALRGASAGRLTAALAMAGPVAILAVNGIAADAPTGLPIRLPTLLLVILTAVFAFSLRRAAPEAAR